MEENRKPLEFNVNKSWNGQITISEKRPDSGPMTGDQKSSMFRFFVFILQWCFAVPVGIVSIIIGCLKKGDGNSVGGTLWILYGIFGLICNIVYWCMAIIPAL